MEGTKRFIAVGITGKRHLMSWADTSWCPSNLVVAITREDDWTMGILSSSIHEAWAREQSSTLEDRLRYTSKRALITFPFPSPGSPQRDKIEQGARDIVAERATACAKLVAKGKKLAGRTAVYNAMDEGAFTDLRAAHKRLDEAVCKSYGWPASVLDDRTDIVDRLHLLNAEMPQIPPAIRRSQGEGDPDALVTSRVLMLGFPFGGAGGHRCKWPWRLGCTSRGPGSLSPLAGQREAPANRSWTCPYRAAHVPRHTRS